MNDDVKNLSKNKPQSTVRLVVDGPEIAVSKPANNDAAPNGVLQQIALYRLMKKTESLKHSA